MFPARLKLLKMEIIDKLLNILGKICLLMVIIWIIGYKLFEKIWKKLTIEP